jgi:outer membrane receptor protein involved in Fe transport
MYVRSFAMAMPSPPIRVCLSDQLDHLHAATRQAALRLTLLAAALGAIFPVQAQQSTGAAIQTAPPQVEVRAAAGAYDARRDDTASKIVVNHDELVKYGDTSVADVLKRVPGVTVGGSGRNSEIRMRGLGNGYTQILIDGERAPQDFAIESLAPDVIERIEIMRVAVAEFSTQAVAGTINIVLKKAVKTDQRTLKLGYAHGAALAAPDASLQLSDRSGALSYSLAASVSRTHDWQQPRTLEQQFDATGNLTSSRFSQAATLFRNTLVNITPRVTWTLDNGDTLTSQTFFNFNQYNRATREQVEALRGTPPEYPIILSQQDSMWRILREELNWVHRFDEHLKLDSKLSGMYTHVTTDTTVIGAGAALPSALHELSPATGDDHGLSTLGKLSSTALPGHTLALGWDAGHTTRDVQRQERDAFQPEVALGQDDRYAIEISRLAMYAQDEWTISPRWSLYIGARWEGILIRTEGSSFAAAHSRSDVWSPVLQTLYKPGASNNDQFRFAVSRTYKAPGLLALLPLRFKSGNNTQTNPDFIGNPNLRPELALGFDAGYEHRWTQGALLSANISQRHIDDYTRNVLTLVDGRWSYSPVNSGQARTRSVELEAKLPLKSLMSTTLALDLRASVARNWSTVQAVPGPDNRLDAQMPLSATLGVDYVSGPLSLGGSYVFRNGGPVRILSNQFSYQSVQRDLDLYALWQFNPRLQLRLAASNLLGQERMRAGDFIFDDASRRHTSTETPSHASARATLQLKF